VQERKARLTYLYASVFLSSLGLGLVSYFIPRYVQSIGGTFVDLGVVGASRSFLYAFLPFIMGYLSDRGIRREMYLLSIAVNLLSTLLLVYAETVLYVVLLQLLASLGISLLWPITEARVAESVDRNERISAMGWYSVSWATGFLLGPTLGGWVIGAGGYDALFITSSAVFLFTLAFTLATLGRSYRPCAATLRHGFSLPSRLLSYVYAAVVAYGVIFSIVVSLFPGYLGAFEYDSMTIGLLFSLFGLFRIFAFLTVDRLNRRLGRWASTISVLLMFLGTGIVGAFSVSSLPMVVLVLALLGYGFGSFFPVTIVYISNRATEAGLGAAVGAYEAFFGIGFVIGPIMGGYLSGLTIAAPYLLCSIISLSMPLLMALQHRKLGA
jgi:DHA1 family multidrug resistance protein-like MFS transporter